MRKFHPSMTQRLMGNVQKNNQLLKAGNSQNLLNLAECISLGSSVTGSILAIVYQQLAYATVPLSLAISLNVLNRNRFQQRMRQDTSANIADVYQVVQSLHQQVHALPAEPVDLDPINQSLEQLEQKTTTLTQQFNARPETLAIAQLTSQFSALALRLDNLPNPPEPVDLSRIEAEIATQKAQLQAIDTSVTSSIAQLQTQLQTQIDQLLQQIQDLPSSFNPSVLDQRLTELERKNHSIFSDDVGSLASVVKNLQSDKAFIQQVLAHLTSQVEAVADEFSARLEAQAIAQRTNLLETLAPQFYARLETQAIPQRPSQLEAVADEESARPDTQAIAHLTNQLNALALRLDNLPNPPEPVDLSGIEAEISTLKLESQVQIIDLYSVIDQLWLQIQDSPPSFDSSALEQRLTELESRNHSIFSEEIKQLTTELDERTTALDERSSNLAQMEQQIEKAQELICALYEQTEHLYNRNRNLDEVQQQLASLWQLVDESAKTTDLESALARLSAGIAGQVDTAIETQISQFRAQLTASLNEKTKHLQNYTHNLDHIKQQLASREQRSKVG